MPSRSSHWLFHFDDALGPVFDSELDNKGRLQMRSPLKSTPARSAGQSVNEQIENQRFNAVEVCLPALMLFGFAIFEWTKVLLNIPPAPLTFTALAVIAAILAAIKFTRIRRELDAYKQGRDGEKTVGHELEKLREHGAHVHHDLLADGFNIDHVVVSTRGIFVIETKTWSKSEPHSETLRFDGQHVIRQGHKPDSNPVKQVQANASYVRSLLAQSTGEHFAIQPIVAFPGWFVQMQPKTKPVETWVLNPKAIGAFINRTKPRLTTEQVHMISHHLSLHIAATQRR
jgi:hypothetical protein